MLRKKSSSVIDKPVTLSNQDKFGISRYENALKLFIEQADTPLTIALQGEWGSGKTSLMNLLKYHLCETDKALFYPVWINTWQHSIMSDPESAIVCILQSIKKKNGCFYQKSFLVIILLKTQRLIDLRTFTLL